MKDDLISRKEAYDVLTEYYHHKTETQHEALREALSLVPDRANDKILNAKITKHVSIFDFEDEYEEI